MQLKLTLSKRDIFGKKANKLTKEGKILGNVYGKGQESIALIGECGPVSKLIKQAGKNHPIELTIEGEKEGFLVLVHEVDRENITQIMHHVTFKIIIKGEKVTTEVPLRLIGDAPALRTGKLVVTLRDSLEIEAIPSQLPEQLEVDVSGLVEEGDSVSIADITFPEGVETKVEDHKLIAKVDMPRAQVEEDVEGEEVIEGEEAEGAADVPSAHGGDTEQAEANDK